MYDHNEHAGKGNNNHNQSKMDKIFLGKLSKFIQSVESEMDILLPGPASLQFMSYYKIIDNIISQKLAKNIIIRLLCTFDEDSTRLAKHLVPFIGYRSIKPSLPKSLSNSLLLIKDKQDIFSFSVNMKNQSYRHDTEGSNPIFSLNNWSYSKEFL